MSIERPAPTLLSELHGGQDALPEELARMALAVGVIEQEHGRRVRTRGSSHR